MRTDAPVPLSASVAVQAEKAVVILREALPFQPSVEAGSVTDAGLRAVLVRTGKYRPGDETRVEPTGGRVFNDLDAVVDYIL